MLTPSLFALMLAMQALPNSDHTLCLDRNLAPAQALQHCHLALRQSPGDRVLLARRGRLRLFRHEFEPALADLNLAISKQPDDLDLILLRALTHQLAGTPRAAQADLLRLLPLLEQPKTAEVHLLRGILWFRHGLPDSALEDFSQAVALDVRLAEAWLGRAAVWLSLSEPEKALADVEAALKLSPDMSEALRYKAQILFKEEKYAQAFNLLNRAVEHHPDDVEAWHDRGNTQIMLGHIAPAMADFNRALQLDPEHVPTYNRRVQVFEQQKLYERALLDYDRLLELEPRNYAFLYRRGYTHLNLKHYEQALSDAQAALTLQPEGYEAIELTLKVYQAQGNTQAENEFLRQSLKTAYSVKFIEILIEPSSRLKSDPVFQKLSADINSGKVEAYLERAYLSARMQDWGMAHRDSQIAQELTHGEVSALNLRGWIYFMQGRPSEAKSYFQDVLASGKSLTETAGWIQAELNNLLAPYASLTKHPRYKLIPPLLAKARQGDHEAMKQVYQELIGLLEGWLLTNPKPGT